ncbi:MAG TPA: hypothetical protein VHK89_08315 [Actinomycetota bacterium]|nr:hypothetical protein [Actinomycetota bacterium]
MNGRSRLGAVLCLVAAASALAPSARAQGRDCGRAVIVTLPGVTWADVRGVRPPHLLRAARAGAVGSVSVRTIATRTTYGAGYATLGAGSRIDGGDTTGSLVGPREAVDSRRPVPDVVASGLGELTLLANEAGYGGRPGALGSAMGEQVLAAVGNADTGAPPPSPAGLERWVLLAAMDDDGVVDLAATGTELLETDPRAPFGVRTDPAAVRTALRAVLRRPCASVVVDPGDVTRADLASVGAPERWSRARGRALLAADALIGWLRGQLDPARDLLLIVSPTAPAWAGEARLGVALVVGEGWPPGSVLQSATTRRAGIVTLPDVAPTVLEHLGVSRPPDMTGRAWFPVEASADDPVAAAIDLNDEAVFVDRLKPKVSVVFIAAQVVVYAVALLVLARAGPGRAGRIPRALEIALELAALAVVAFPPSAYLAGAFEGHELGTAAFVGALLATDALLVAVACTVARAPLARLLVVTSGTALLLIADLASGGRLQLNTVLGYSPIVAGRFSGIGNIAFAVLGAAGIVAGALLVHLARGRRAAHIAAAALFVAIVVADGAPQLGSDVGGVLALVPSLGITMLLLAGRRPSVRVVLAAGVGAIVVLGAFLAVDLARPPQQRTHLARLWTDVADRGAGALADTVRRKAEANLRVFLSTAYTLFVPPALGVMAWLLARPRGGWGRLAADFPRARAGLVGGLVLSVLGFAINDSGIVIPAVVLSYLVPFALLLHLVLYREQGG